MYQRALSRINTRSPSDHAKGGHGVTRSEFDELVHKEGYTETKLVHFEPLSRSETHSHDKVSFVFVLEGEFILNTAVGAACYSPGETCLLEKNINHAEEAGPNGATILVARK